MSLLTKQEKQKWLTFEEICEHWSHALRYRSSDKDLNITNCKYCIVGEAYKFSPNYNCCDECGSFSKKFVWYVDGINCTNPEYNKPFKIYDEQGFEELKSEFVEHWNMKHVRH